MRARLPKGRGIWPAFWMLSATRPLKWPKDGEIGIPSSRQEGMFTLHNYKITQITLKYDLK